MARIPPRASHFTTTVRIVLEHTALQYLIPTLGRQRYMVLVTLMLGGLVLFVASTHSARSGLCVLGVILSTLAVPALWLFVAVERLLRALQVESGMVDERADNDG